MEEGLSFINAPSTAALSRRKPASSEISRDSSDDQTKDKRNAL
jgi:hypothetical protein